MMMKNLYQNKKDAKDPESLHSALQEVSKALRSVCKDIRPFAENKPRSLKDLGGIYVFFDKNLDDNDLNACLLQVNQITAWMDVAENDINYNYAGRLHSLPSWQNLKDSLVNQIITSVIQSKNQPTI